MGGEVMPIYEYRCADCGKISDFLEGIGQEEIEKECKYCGSKQLNRMLSVSHVSSGRSTVGSQNGGTCCGRAERCEKPPCSDDEICKR